MKKCNNCNKEFNDEFLNCDICGGELIANIKEQVEDNANETLESSEKTYCVFCGGEIYNKSYCSHCGKSSIDENIRHCVKCGTQLAPNQKFCSKCGEKISNIFFAEKLR